MTEKVIAVLEGDGIGPEIMAEALKVLDTIGKKYVKIFYTPRCSFGAQSYFDNGSAFPENTQIACDKADAILKGPIGVDAERTKLIPKELRAEPALLSLRKRYDTFANFRPVKLLPELIDASPLKSDRLEGGLDIMMVRELVGGIYFGNKIEGEKTHFEYAKDECEYTREQVERIAHIAFKEAKSRGSKLTNVHKNNVLATSRFWNSVVEEVAKQYSEVKLEHQLVDSVAYDLVLNPTKYNGVMLLENMMGDILTDEAGGVLGSLGLMPSACIGPEKAYFEPAHGSAPNIAGKNEANPYSMIGSVAMMMDYFCLENESKDIWNALAKVFGEGYRTKELAAKDTAENKLVTTSQFGDLVVENILRN